MSKYVLVENSSDAAALYEKASGNLLKAGHIDDVRERLLTLLEEDGVVEHFINASTMPEGKFKWSDTYATLDEFRAALSEGL